jgi:hypothetical protein
MDDKKKNSENGKSNKGGKAPEPTAPARASVGSNGKNIANLTALVPYIPLDELKKDRPGPRPAAPVKHPFDGDQYYTSKPDAVKPDAEEVRNAGKIEGEYNAAVIQAAFLEIVKEKHRFPKYKELAEKTGLSFGVLNTHIKKIKFGEQANVLKILTPLVLLNLTNQALAPDASPYTIVSWLKVVAGYVEKEEKTLTNRIDFRETVHHLLEVKDDADRSKRLSAYLNATNRQD